jgi:hypothetical protein
MFWLACCVISLGFSSRAYVVCANCLFTASRQRFALGQRERKAGDVVLGDNIAGLRILVKDIRHFPVVQQERLKNVRIDRPV